MNLRTASASLLSMTWVLLIGSLADMHDLRANTAFAFGVMAGVPAFLLADVVLVGRRRG